MSSKVHKKDFDKAAEAFKAAEAEVVRLAKRGEDIGQRLLQTKLVHAQLGTDVDKFAIGDGSIDEQLAQHAGMVRDLSAKRSEAEGAIALLERAVDAAETGYAEAKVKLVLAEETARQSQAAYFASLNRELIDAFMLSNREALQRILQVTNAEGFHEAYARERSFSNIRGMLICAVDNLIETVIAEASTRMTKADDEAFHSVLGKTERGDPPYMPLQSTQITAAERGRLNSYCGIGRGATHAQLLEMLSQDDTPIGRHEPLNRALADSEVRRLDELIADRRKELAPLQAEIDAGNGGHTAQRISMYYSGYTFKETFDKLTDDVASLEKRAAMWRGLLEADAAKDAVRA